jgi:hypothetical protein
LGKLDVVESDLASLLLGEIKFEPIDLYMKDIDEILGSIGWEIVQDVQDGFLSRHITSCIVVPGPAQLFLCLQLNLTQAG